VRWEFCDPLPGDQESCTWKGRCEANTYTLTTSASFRDNKTPEQVQFECSAHGSDDKAC